MKYFKKSFTQQEPLSDSAIQAAAEVMLSGRLHRYNTVAGEPSEVDLLEQEFAAYLGAPYCLACSSGGYAIHIAMRAAGVKPGDKVLSNAFTLAPVPGAIHNSGAIPILIEVADDYCIDLDDLEAKASTREAKVLLLSHMRGHIADMDRIAIICQRYELFLIEDCAHTMALSGIQCLAGYRPTSLAIAHKPTCILILVKAAYWSPAMTRSWRGLLSILAPTCFLTNIEQRLRLPLLKI